MFRSLAMFSVAACLMGAARPDPEPMKLPKADTRGTVTEVRMTDSFADFAWFSTTGKKEADTRYGGVRMMTIGAATKFYLWKGGKKAEAAFEDLKVGCKVQVIFAEAAVEGGAVVKASAKEVLILETPKKK